MKVAFITTDRINVNAHFGGAQEVDIYEVSESGYEFLHTLDFETGAKKANEGKEEAKNKSNIIDFAEKKESLCKHGKADCKKNQEKVKEEPKKAKDDESDGKIVRKIAVISDCTIVYVASVGGTAAAKLIKNNIMPVKPRSEKENISYILNRLVQTLKGNPPPWLRKALQPKSQDIETYETVN